MFILSYLQFYLFCQHPTRTSMKSRVANLISEAALKFEVLIKEFGSFDVFTLKQGSECKDELFETANLQDIINDGSYLKIPKVPKHLKRAEREAHHAEKTAEVEERSEQTH